MGRALEQTFGAGAITAEERVEMDAGSAVMREHLANAAAREWDLLSDEEKRAILLVIHRLAEERQSGRRGGAVEGLGPPVPMRR